MKRFTATEKWRDKWFRRLSLESKLLWQWLCDNCDQAGVIDLDLESASFDIGKPIQEQHLSELSSRLQPLKNGKLWIRGFIPFQYGTLSRECRPHGVVFEALNHHGLLKEFMGQHTPQDGSNGSESQRVSKGYPNPTNTAKEKDKEKDQEKDRRGTGVLGTNGDGLVQRTTELRSRLNNAYNRGQSDRWQRIEEDALCEIAQREHCIQEFEELMVFRPKRGKFFPHSLPKLLENWTSTLDAARNGQACTEEPRVKREAIRELIEVHVANPESAFYNADCSSEDKSDLRNLKQQERTLTAQIARA